MALQGTFCYHGNVESAAQFLVTFSGDVGTQICAQRECNALRTRAEALFGLCSCPLCVHSFDGLLAGLSAGKLLQSVVTWSEILDLNAIKTINQAAQLESPIWSVNLPATARGQFDSGPLCS